MARRKHHEEHINAEAWAIPYADLMTLLLAFFVVMYAISSLNEGKYRAVADSLSSAFGGTPRTISPIQLGQAQLRGSAFDRPSIQTAAARSGPSVSAPVTLPSVRQALDVPIRGQGPTNAGAPAARQRAEAERRQALQALGRRIEEALSPLVREELVTVRRGEDYLEVEIQSDILFASGAAVPSAVAVDTVRRLAGVLRDEPNAIRVEGYTDDVPIANARFPSNWELSAARAASVVHELVGAGLAPRRLAMVGYGEHQPVADNATPEGRNANRRVLLVILAAPAGPDAVVAADAPLPTPEPTGDAATAPAPAPPGAG